MILIKNTPLSLPPSLPILEKAMLSTSKVVFTQRIT